MFLGSSIVEAESNKLNLETRDQNYLTILKALTLMSLWYSFSKYDICSSQSRSANNITDIQKEVRL